MNRTNAILYIIAVVLIVDAFDGGTLYVYLMLLFAASIIAGIADELKEEKK